MAECKIDRPSPKSLFNKVMNMFSVSVLGGSSVIPESNEWRVVSMDYALHEQFYSYSEQQWRETDPRYACCENLISMASNDGIYPKPASFASGYVKLTGVVGSVLTQNMEVSFNGYLYIPAGQVPAAIGLDGTSIIRMRALEPGPESNIASGATNGTLTQPIDGVDNTVTVYGGQFCGGSVAEECEQFRTRYLDRMRFKPKFGLDFIKNKVLEWPCVTSVCDRGGECCNLSIDAAGAKQDCSREIQIYAIFDGTFPCGLAPECVTDEITEWIFGETQGIGEGQAEWGMIGKVYTATAAYVDIRIDGLNCASPSLLTEIEQRINEFSRRLCPSQAMRVQDLKVIISQLVGTTENYDVVISSVVEDDEHIFVNLCGDAEPNCDYKICLSDIIFTNPRSQYQGMCG